MSCVYHVAVEPFDVVVAATQAAVVAPERQVAAAAAKSKLGWLAMLRSNSDLAEVRQKNLVQPWMDHLE